MYTLTKSDIASFAPLAQLIKPDERLPILSYLLFSFNENGFTITKNSLKNYVIKQYDTPGEGQFLIQESSLFNYVNNCNSEAFTVEVGKLVLTLRSEGFEFETPTDDVANYPVPASGSDTGEPIDEETIRQIGTASNFNDQEGTPTPRGHVFTGDGYVMAGNGALVYFYPTNTIKLVLRKETAELVGKIGSCNYARHGNYDLFSTLTATFGFIKPDISWFDLKIILKEFVDEFTLYKADIISFCKFCISENKNDLIRATMQRDGEGVIFKMVDGTVNKKIQRHYVSTGGPEEPFKFNVEYMLRMCLAIKGDSLIFGPGDKRYFVRGDGYTAIIGSIQ